MSTRSIVLTEEDVRLIVHSLSETAAGLSRGAGVNEESGLDGSVHQALGAAYERMELRFRKLFHEHPL